MRTNRFAKFVWRWYRPKRKLLRYPLAIHSSTLIMITAICVLVSPWLVIPFYASLTWHEYCHIWMAERFKIETKEITVTGIGAAAMMDAAEEFLENGEAEMKVAFVGPVASAALAAACYASSSIFAVLGWNAVSEVAAQVGVVNVILGAWNLIPFYPMDGGRVLRGYLHAYHFTTWEEKAALNKTFKFINNALVGASAGLIVGGMWLPMAVLLGLNRAAMRELSLTEKWIKARIGDREYEARRLFADYVKNLDAVRAGGAWWRDLGLRSEPKSFAECKRAYRKKILQVHPDRGGSKAKMQRVTAAYDLAKMVFRK